MVKFLKPTTYGTDSFYMSFKKRGKAGGRQEDKDKKQKIKNNYKYTL